MISNRHPLISLLGTMYLNKLKHGSEFISNAGSSWRLLFVYALFPWMSTYRIPSEEPKEEQNSNYDNQEFNLSKFSTLRSEFSMK